MRMIAALGSKKNNQIEFQSIKIVINKYVMSRFMYIIILTFVCNVVHLYAQSNEEKLEHWRSWEKLGKIEYEERDYNGEMIYWPVAPKELKELHKKEIIIRGFLILKYADFKHYEFFLSKVPESQCYFCGGSGPETVLMVTAKEIIKPTFLPVSLKGKIYINTTEPEEPLYWLKDAELIK